MIERIQSLHALDICSYFIAQLVTNMRLISDGLRKVKNLHKATGPVKSKIGHGECHCNITLLHTRKDSIPLLIFNSMG